MLILARQYYYFVNDTKVYATNQTNAIINYNAN